MSKYLYEVCLEGGRSHPKFQKFLNNVNDLNGKAPDYGGINNLCIVSHHMDEVTVKTLCCEGLKRHEDDVTVTEITKQTLSSSNSHHRIYTDLLESYFFPHDRYPNIR